LPTTDAATWSIPAERMKVPRPHRVPLSAHALALLAKLPRFIAGNGQPVDLVFPGSSASQGRERRSNPHSSVMLG